MTRRNSGTEYFIRKKFHHSLDDGTIVYYDVRDRYELPKVKKVKTAKVEKKPLNIERHVERNVEKMNFNNNLR